MQVILIVGLSALQLALAFCLDSNCTSARYPIPPFLFLSSLRLGPSKLALTLQYFVSMSSLSMEGYTQLKLLRRPSSIYDCLVEVQYW